MHENHPLFKAPENPETRIWRYMAISAFLWMLQNRGLFFPTVENLAKADPYEGTPSSFSIEDLLRRLLADVPNVDSMNLVQLLDLAPTVRERMSWRPMQHFVSCWHMNESESIAMWHLYSRMNDGIAIQSTYRRLRECCRSINDTVYIGAVKYIDYATQPTELTNLFGPVLCKRNIFAHERELRAAIHFPTLAQQATDGVPVQMDLSELIEAAYVAPNTEGFALQALKELTRKYEYAFPIHPSSVGIRPLGR